jgi:chorismate mutase
VTHDQFESDPLAGLNRHRKRLDDIDQALLGLIEERLALAREIALTKSSLNPTENLPRLYSPEREAQLIEALIARAGSAEIKALIPNLWRVLMSASLRLQASHFSELVIMASKSAPYFQVEKALNKYFFSPSLVNWVEHDKALIKAIGTETQLCVLGIMPLEAKIANYAYLLASDTVHVVAGDLKDFASGSGLLILARHPPEISGNDITLFVSDANLRPAQWEEAISKAGFAGSYLMGGQGFSLLGLYGYVQKDDVRLEAIPGKLKGCVGALPLIDYA